MNCLPFILFLSFVNQKIQEWTLQQEQTGKNQATLKLYFRPFLRWLDKNLISLFIDGGKQVKTLLGVIDCPQLPL